MFINFNPRSAPEQPDRLPKGGATIGVTAANEMPGAESSPKWLRSTHDWAADEARNGGMISNPNISPIAFPQESGVSEAVMTAYDDPTFSPDDQNHHSVLVFWKFNGKLFSGHLTYVKGSAEGPQLEKIFLETLRSTRPLAK